VSEVRSFERRVRFLSLAGIGVTLTALSIGLVLSWMGSDAARTLLMTGIAALVIMPVITVLTALAEEIRRRDWAFAAAALAVLAILAYNVSQALP
jgi:putative Mn2+ efflux pump MntP